MVSDEGFQKPRNQIKEMAMDDGIADGAQFRNPGNS